MNTVGKGVGQGFGFGCGCLLLIGGIVLVLLVWIGAS